MYGRTAKQEIMWATHNLFAHPMSEVLYWMGLGDIGDKLHDITVPEHDEGTGRG